MVAGRVFMGLVSLLAASSAQAATYPQVRLPLSLHMLGGGAEISYHPSRWLTIRRNMTYVQTIAPQEMGLSSVPARPKPRGYAMTGDIHPFRDGLRLSIGVREDDNRRLLHTTTERRDPGTAQYAPMISIGYGEEVAPGLSIGGDLGMVGTASAGRFGRGGMLVTPVDFVQRDSSTDYQPVLLVSAAYRF